MVSGRFWGFRDIMCRAREPVHGVRLPNVLRAGQKARSVGRTWGRSQTEGGVRASPAGWGGTPLERGLVRSPLCDGFLDRSLLLLTHPTNLRGYGLVATEGTWMLKSVCLFAETLGLGETWGSGVPRPLLASVLMRR